MIRRLALLLALALAGPAPLYAQTSTHPHAQLRLVSEASAVAPGAKIWVAVEQTMEPGWHTYWRNPGDAGAATTIAWTLPTGWTAGAIQWPTPKRLPLGPIMNYGYEGKVVLPVAVTAPANAAAGQTARLMARVDYLVCAQVCVPERADLSLSLPIASATTPDTVGAAIVRQGLDSLPRSGGLSATLQKTSTGVSLAVAGAPLAGVRGQDAYFYPYDGTLLDQAKDQPVDRGPRGLTFALTTAPAPPAAPGGASPPSPNLSQLSGVVSADGVAYEVNASPGPPPAGSGGLGPPAAKVAPPALAAVLGAALAAFLGGLILNLMPCVFPIVSMKAAALASGHGEGRSQGLAYLVGVVVTFAGLGGALILARAGGAAVGWGFQLQSPIITASLALVLLAAALNLSGIFEIGTSLQGIGSAAASRSGVLGSLLTGVLAVVVAAPCTAPFMGPAVGFALTQNALVAMSVFLALGLGFAAPFTILALSPALLRLAPRPGPWMETFRKVLAFPMYAAAAWLAWVMAQQVDAQGLARLFAAAVALAFSAWLLGRVQTQRAVGRPSAASGGLAAASLAAAVAALVMAPFGAPAQTGAAAGSVGGADGLGAKPWSEAAVSDLRAANHPVLVNFTAAWCVTCQYNDKTALAAPQVAAAFKRTGAAYLVADWTNRNADIAKALAARGRAGVPLYLVYSPAKDEPVVLPQILTPDVVVHALDAASTKAG